MKYLIFLWSMLAVIAYAEDYRIISPENPKPWEKATATELKSALTKSIGKGISIGNAPVEFHVGATDFVKNQNWNLQDEQWCIKSFGNKVVLYGGGTRGTLYAMAIFLERFLGVRYFNMLEELFPRHEKEVSLPALDLQGKPEFVLRSIYPDFRAKRDNGRYAVFNRMNAFGPVEFSAAYGGAFEYGSPYLVHTFNKYIPEKEYFKEHPEYFALIGNKRNPHHKNGQLCLSNPALEDIFWQKLQQYILNDEAKAAAQGIPSPAIYDISQNDNNSVCSCENCNQLRKQYGNAEAGLQLALINKLARRLKEFRPNLKISTLAYCQTEKIPTGIELEKNILVRLCNTANNYAGSILDKGEAPYRERLLQWGKLADALGTWDYGVSFNRHAKGLPYPSEFFMQDMVRFYRDHNVRYLFTEREHEHRSDMHTMKGWLLAKLMENPDADFNALFHDFLRNYYGKAAPFIAEYRKTLLESAKKHQTYITAYMPPAIAFSHLDCATVSRCDELLQQAEEAVKNDATLLRRVREARAGIDEATVIFIRKFNLESPGHRLDVAAAEKRMWDTYEKSTRFFFRDEAYKAALQRIHLHLDVYDKLPKTIPPQTIVPGGIDIPIELAAFWAGGDKLVSDSESALGYAVKVAVSPSGLSMHKLPLRAGGYDPQTRMTHYGAGINANDVPGPGYHWYRFKPVKPISSAYLYLTNPWYIQFPENLAAAKNPDVLWNIRASIKFTGPAFPHGKPEEENAIFIDRIVMDPAL